MASVCEKTVRNEIDRGKLGHVRVATALRITSTQYEDWIRRGTVKPTL